MPSPTALALLSALPGTYTSSVATPRVSTHDAVAHDTASLSRVPHLSTPPDPTPLIKRYAEALATESHPLAPSLIFDDEHERGPPPPLDRSSAQPPPHLRGRRGSSARRRRRKRGLSRTALCFAILGAVGGVILLVLALLFCWRSYGY
jgi:hypothetical protein